MTDSELFEYAIHGYNNPACKTAEEFSDDYNTIIKIKKLLNKRSAGFDVNNRLILNHFTMMYNVFTPIVCTVLLFAKLPKEHYSTVKTILTFLNYMPDVVPHLGVISGEISFDDEMVDFLRGI